MSNHQSESKNASMSQCCKEDKEDKSMNKNIDNKKKIIHDIRNIKYLDKEMLSNIRNMSNQDKMDIIITFNEVINGLKALLE